LSPSPGDHSKALLSCGEWVLFVFLAGEPLRPSSKPTLPKHPRTGSPRPSSALKLNPLPDGDSKELLRCGERVLPDLLAAQPGRPSFNRKLPKPDRNRSRTLSSPLEPTLPPEAILRGCSAVGSDLCRFFCNRALNSRVQIGLSGAVSVSRRSQS
jgi:hypothetical protein